MNDPADRSALVRAIHDSPLMVVLAVTGGGVGAIADLLVTAGASRTILDVRVPYSPAALAKLTGTSDSAVSKETARAMARACLAEARGLRKADGTPVAGVACTAALVTDRVRRGEDRACIAYASEAGERAWELTLTKQPPSAAGDERVAQDRAVANEILEALAELAGVRQ